MKILAKIAKGVGYALILAVCIVTNLIFAYLLVRLFGFFAPIR